MECYKCKKMNYMFSECYSLRSLPDLFKWKSKAKFNIEIDHIFYKCHHSIQRFCCKKIYDIN